MVATTAKPASEVGRLNAATSKVMPTICETLLGRHPGREHFRYVQRAWFRLALAVEVENFQSSKYASPMHDHNNRSLAATESTNSTSAFSDRMSQPHPPELEIQRLEAVVPVHIPSLCYGKPTEDTVRRADISGVLLPRLASPSRLAC